MKLVQATLIKKHGVETPNQQIVDLNLKQVESFQFIMQTVIYAYTVSGNTYKIEGTKNLELVSSMIG